MWKETGKVAIKLCISQSFPFHSGTYPASTGQNVKEWYHLGWKQDSVIFFNLMVTWRSKTSWNMTEFISANKYLPICLYICIIFQKIELQHFEHFTFRAGSLVGVSTSWEWQTGCQQGPEWKPGIVIDQLDFESLTNGLDELIARPPQNFNVFF